MLTITPPPRVGEKILISALIGSHAYGTATEESDMDFMTVTAAPDNVYLSLDWFGQQGTKERKQMCGDVILSESTEYEVTKFMRLCQNFNPNVIPLLWLPDDLSYLTVHPLGQLLIDNRKIFNSKIALHSFVGYASGQIAKMGADNPATGKMGAKRKELRDKFGYDTKYMMHALRLSRMILEFFLNNGEGLHVDRTGIDAEELKAIRAGSLSYEAGKEKIEMLLALAKIQAARSSLPEEPDKEAIRDLARYILRKHLEL